jgi:RimJ/RimL family protein N-acetyltransferase
MGLEGLPVGAKLKGGPAVTIRGLEAQDGLAVLEFFRSLPEEDRMFLRDDVTSPRWLEQFLRSIDSETVVSLVAEREKRIVGNATLYRTKFGWTAHVAQIRVAVARDLQRKGLGTAMAHELVRLAIGFGTEKLVAEVVDNQVGAKRAFEKLGFRPEAVLKGHVKDVRGVRRDLVILSSDVSHVWEAMEALTSDYLPERD